MKKKCPPGVICLENISMVFIVVIVAFILYFSYFVLAKQNNSYSSHEKNDIYNNISKTRLISQFLPPPIPGDVLRNPYIPPLSDERYLIPQINLIPPHSIPINISTNVGAVDTSYRQVGILNPTNKPNKDNVLPLMGRPVFTNRDKWQYYTIGNQYNSVKLPIIVKSKSGLNEYGVDRLYNGDTVYIEGLNDIYRTTIYDNDTIKYLPFI
jgi:Family of unknown function (DUF5755)